MKEQLTLEDIRDVNVKAIIRPAAEIQDKIELI